MVSTRGIKLKFSENERVLCYEPDPTKAKVLYDSKVLDVVIAKDERGKRTVEYLIHFQGWNSSWDRYVSEEYVLKDTPENRQLQKDLAEKSQLQLGAYLYRRDRKKHRKPSDRIGSDDGSSGSPARMDPDDCREASSTSDDDSSIDEEVISIELTPDLRSILEQDYYLINTKNKLLRLPAEPNIITILEQYWKHYATNQVGELTEKNQTKYRNFFNQNSAKPTHEDIQRNLSVCSEVLDGIRIYFDFQVNTVLLYKSERGQVETSPAKYTNPTFLAKDDVNHKSEINYLDYLNTNSNNEDENENKSLSRRRTLRSNNKSTDSVTNGAAAETVSTKPSSSIIEVNSNGAEAPPQKPSWRLLPESVYNQQPPSPCLVYGAVHLARLFVKMPDLLGQTSIDEVKLKTLLHHFDSFIDYLNEHKEWFGEKFYIDKDKDK